MPRTFATAAAIALLFLSPAAHAQGGPAAAPDDQHQPDKRQSKLLPKVVDVAGFSRGLDLAAGCGCST